MSENKIIHITGDFESLNSILSSESFRLSYSRENFYSNSHPISKAAHPMVCFSEYNLENIHLQNITYGKYGIGFSKEWARNKRIGPVLYVSQNSLAAKGMSTLLRARQNPEESKLPKNLRLPIMELKCFIKNEQGYNSHFDVEDFDFKSENEWRYVPEKLEIDYNFISQSQKIYNKKREDYNKRLLDYPLKFNLSDIELVFVSNKDEVSEIADKFKIDRELIKTSNWKSKKLKRANTQHMV
ncbi:MAG: abortive infection system antitoxin AbiGi family protein [Candidatus Neomarinimicrobiota bacterium]